MAQVIIGIDPDSDKHGVAVYYGGKLVTLKSMGLPELAWIFRTYEPLGAEVHIENVCGQNAAFGKSGVKNARAHTAINRSVGKCQQAQIEVERFAEYYGLKVVRHRISKQWKKDKSLFEKATGWKGRSNEDTRSSAYFGFLGCK